MESLNLPNLQVAPDTMRYGWSSGTDDVRAVHPVQASEIHFRENVWSKKMKTVENIYGSAAAMRLQTEKSLLERYTRLPGLPSSNVGLETLMGTDCDLDFDDFLNVPEENPEYSVNVHDHMEHKLRM